MRKTFPSAITALLVMFLVQGCASTPKEPAAPEKKAPVVVLIIGDSISMETGYLKGVRDRLGEGYTVEHNPGNGGDSANVLANLETWARASSPDVVHFNSGLHDIRLDRETKTHQVPVDSYRRNLDAVARWLKQNTDARLVYALTTPVNTEWHAKRRPYDRELADVQRYNEVARGVMKRHRIPVNNLYDVIAGAGPDACLADDGVHMNARGNALLAEAVAAKIRALAPAR